MILRVGSEVLVYNLSYMSEIPSDKISNFLQWPKRGFNSFVAIDAV